MISLCSEILAEPEYQDPVKIEEKKTFTRPKTAKIDSATQIIVRAMAKREHTCLAFSGGNDSLVLLDIIAKAGYKPTIIWCDTQMEYPGSQDFIISTVTKYKMGLRIARGTRTPFEQWSATGWPMLGKMAARLWMQKNKDKGIMINVSECCRALKISPARILTRNLGCGVQFTGQRGQVDDNLRGLRSLKDGTLFYQKRDRLWIANPLTGWSDPDIQGYVKHHKLQEHPAKVRGAKTIGCVYCGGGSQYTNSGFRVLRKTWPEAWYKFMVDWTAGLVILALKYKCHIGEVCEAVESLGSLDKLAKERPWIFDFTRRSPLPGYDK